MTKNLKLIMIFGSNLKKYRKLRDLSQRDLFALCGIDHARISRMEKGQINVTITTISILSKTLNVHSWQLLFPDDDQIL